MTSTKIFTSLMITLTVFLLIFTYLLYADKVSLPGMIRTHKDFDSMVVHVFADSSMQIDLYDGNPPKLISSEKADKITPNDGFEFRHVALGKALPYICEWYDLTPPASYPEGVLNGRIRLDLSQEGLLAVLKEKSGLKYKVVNRTLCVN